jgi:hypothetical protein
MRLRVLLATTLALMALPASASAWTVAADTNATGMTVVMVGTAGADDLRVDYDNPQTLIRVYSGTNVQPDTANLPTGCVPHPTVAGSIRCSISGFGPNSGTITQVRFDLGAGGDTALSSLPFPGTYNGGAGNDALVGGPGPDAVNGGDDNDQVRGGAGSDQIDGGAGDDALADCCLGIFLTGYESDGVPDSLTGGPGTDSVAYDGNNGTVAVSLDDQANDGANEGDNVHSDVENVTTGLGSDVLVGSSAANTLIGGGGADQITGGAGQDNLQGAAGQDTINARDFEADTVDCGTGGGPNEAENDTATLDDIDTASNCENRTVAPADADGDGVRGNTDCNDTDATIKPGAVEIRGNAVDENCDGIAEQDPPQAEPAGPGPIAPITPPPAITPTLGVSVSSVWKYVGTVTIVKSMQVKPAIAGSRVVVTCTGKTCPLKKKVLAVASAGPKVDLTALFKKRKLKPGTVITVQITAPQVIGRVFRYTIRKKKAPKKASLCLAPGASKPTACA